MNLSSEEASKMCDNNNITGATGMDYAGVHSSKKRRLQDISGQYQESPSPIPSYSRHFLPIQKNSNVFITQQWKPTGTSIFCPMSHDLFVNLQKYEQITTADGNFFVGDVSGNYSRSVTGQVIHLWKYDKISRQFFVAQSILFTNSQDFHILQSILFSL